MINITMEAAEGAEKNQIVMIERKNTIKIKNIKENEFLLYRKIHF